MNTSFSQRALPRTGAFTKRLVLSALNSGEPVSEQARSAQARARWPHSTDLNTIMASDVPASGDSGGFALDPASATGQFIAAVKEATVLGALALHELPFRVSIPALTTTANSAVVGTGKSIPCSAAAFERINFTGKKAACIVVVSKELLRASTVAERALQVTMTNASVKAVDAEFIAAGIGGISAIDSGATEAWSATQQIDALINALIAGTENTDRCAIVVHPKTALLLASLRSFTGGYFFPEVAQGRIRTLPLMQSSGCPTDVVAAVDGYRLAAGFGTARIERSGAAQIEMSDTPTGDTGQGDGTPIAASQTFVSIFQLDLAALKVVVEFDFQLIGSGGFQWLDNFAPASTTME